MRKVTIISGVERRRVWTEYQKRALVEAAGEPGASVAEILRRADLQPRQFIDGGAILPGQRHWASRR
jgi:transposase